MSSQRKIEANRLNAQHSTGPQTPEGKAAVSKNALKHGFFAQDVVLKGEDPGNEFPVLLEGLHDEWQPGSPTEQHLVETLAAAMWRLRRAHRIVSGQWHKPGWDERNRSYPPGEKGNLELIERWGAAFKELDKHEAHLHRIIEKSLRQLRQIRRDRQLDAAQLPSRVSNPQPVWNQQTPVTPQDPEHDETAILVPPDPPHEG